MNAIIALCHFCEVHGPSVMFCTQALHSSDPQEAQEHDGSLEMSGSYYSREPQSLESQLEGATSPQKGDNPATPASPTAKTSDLCEACRSFPPGQPGYISNDHEAKVSYVSSQYPHNQQVFSVVRQACVRSLSCEVCPGREGPIFFGDDHRGHVLSYTFFIQDSQSRGLRRWYSIIVVMMDRIYLLNSWPFLVSQLRSVIEEIQEKANKVYEAEQAKCPQRAHRLTQSMASPSNFLQHRGGNKAARSLAELTHQKNVFRELHGAFTWILQAGGSRLTERLLEGPPTEDSVIDLEQQEETEEGFVKLYSKKEVVEEHVEEGIEDSCEYDPSVPTFCSLRHFMSVVGAEKFHDLAHHIIIGNQLIVRGTERAIIKSIIDCLKTLLPRGCCRLIYYSDKYEDSWRCNFLGLPNGTPLPSHADMYVVLDIKRIANQSADGISPPPSSPFEGYQFDVATMAVLPERGPAVLTKMEAALTNGKLADTVVDQCLVCLKEEWMNKVKVLFKFTKAGGNRSEEDTRKLLQVVGAQTEDKAVLQFWMTGLSVQYRNHMLSSAINKTVTS